MGTPRPRGLGRRGLSGAARAAGRQQRGQNQAQKQGARSGPVTLGEAGTEHAESMDAVERGVKDSRRPGEVHEVRLDA